MISTNPQGGSHQEGGTASSSSHQAQPAQEDSEMTKAAKRTGKQREDQRMKEAEEDKEMQSKERKRERDQREEGDLEDQASKYATVEVNQESINNIYWLCTMSNNQEFVDDISGKTLNKELTLKARIEQNKKQQTCAG